MLEYPILSDADGGAWLVPDNVAEFARVAEESGIDAIALTDHPAPSKKWLDGGGHETLDPFVGLAFCAAVTSRINLMTNLTVVPYRNPLLMARSMTSVDVLSGGRTIFTLGTGYLRSEFAALGVDFEERNALFDEAIEVLLGVWSTTDSSTPSPPRLLVRGAALHRRSGRSSSPARCRSRTRGSGWAATPRSCSTGSRVGGTAGRRCSVAGRPWRAPTRTAVIGSDEKLASMIRDLGARLEANGRSLADIDICAASIDGRYTPGAPEEFLDSLGRLEAMGVTWSAGIHVDADRSRACARRPPPVRRGSDRESPLSPQSVFTDNSGVRIHALDNEVRRLDAASGCRRARNGGVGRGVLVARRGVRHPARGRRRRAWARAERCAGDRLPVGRPHQRRRGRGHLARSSTGRCWWRSRRGSSYALGYALAHPTEVRGLVDRRLLRAPRRSAARVRRAPARRRPARCPDVRADARACGDRRRAGESRGAALGSSAGAPSVPCS